MARIKTYDKQTQTWVYADKSFSKIPIRGKDYYTEEDKAYFESFIMDEFLKRGQIGPNFADSIEGCTDPNKLYVLPDNLIYAYMKGGGYINRVKEAVDADDSLYEGCGYVDGFQLNSNDSAMSLTAADGYTVTGYIPVTQTDVVRMAGTSWDQSGKCIIAYYDEDKKPLGGFINKTHTSSEVTSEGYAFPAKPIHTGQQVDKYILDKTKQKIVLENGVYTFNMVFHQADGGATASHWGGHRIKYMRISAFGKGEKMIITINEEIYGKQEAGMGWYSTGHSFIPTDYEDRIIAIEESLNSSFGGTAEINPSTSIEELKDLYARGSRIVIDNPSDNLVPKAISKNGFVYNGCGYRKEYWLDSDGEPTALDDGVLTGFIPCQYNKTLQIIGGLHQGDDYGNRIATYDNNFNMISIGNIRSWVRDSDGLEIPNENNVKTFTINTGNLLAFQNAAYVRVSLRPCIGRNVQVRYI